MVRQSFMAPDLTRQDIAKADKALKQEMAHLDKVQKEIMRVKLVLEGRKGKAKMGEFSRDIWENGAIHGQAKSALTHLPTEIQMMVMAHLDRVDQVALALTCKAHAKIDSLKTMKLPGSKRKTITHIHRLGLLLRLSTWMKPEYRLCYSCICYINTSRSAHGGNWAGSADIVTRGIVGQKAIKEGPRCSICRQREEMNLKKDSAECKAWAKKARKLVSGPK